MLKSLRLNKRLYHNYFLLILNKIVNQVIKISQTIY